MVFIQHSVYLPLDLLAAVNIVDYWTAEFHLDDLVVICRHKHFAFKPKLVLYFW